MERTRVLLAWAEASDARRERQHIERLRENVSYLVGVLKDRQRLREDMSHLVSVLKGRGQKPNP